MKDHINVHVPAGATTVEPSGATDDIRYVLNSEAPVPVPAPLAAASTDAGGAEPAGAGGLSDAVIDNADGQLPDKTDSTIRGGKVGQESKRGAY